MLLTDLPFDRVNCRCWHSEKLILDNLCAIFSQVRLMSGKGGEESAWIPVANSMGKARKNMALFCIRSGIRQFINFSLQILSVLEIILSYLLMIR